MKTAIGEDCKFAIRNFSANEKDTSAHLIEKLKSYYLQPPYKWFYTSKYFPQHGARIKRTVGRLCESLTNAICQMPLPSPLYPCSWGASCSLLWHYWKICQRYTNNWTCWQEHQSETNEAANIDTWRSDIYRLNIWLAMTGSILNSDKVVLAGIKSNIFPESVRIFMAWPIKSNISVSCRTHVHLDRLSVDNANFLMPCF